MKAVRDTSIEAYRDLRNSPRLAECQEKVFGVFCTRPGKPDWSNKEIAQALGWDVCNVTPRVYELRQMGLLEFSRKRLCTITGRRVLSWRLSTRISQ